MIIDSHCHAWPRWPYDPNAFDAAVRGTAEQLIRELDDNGVDRAVAVAGDLDRQSQPSQHEYLVELAARAPQRFMLVAEIDSFWSENHHRAGRADRLARLLEGTPFVGVAHWLTGPDDGGLLTEDAVRAWRLVHQLGLVLRFHAPPAWHSSVQQLGRTLPELPIVLHHQGMVQDDHPMDGLLDLAKLPNIYVAVSGFHHLAEQPWRYPYPAGRERLVRLVDTFGPHRLLWGSDYPVCEKYGVSYRQTLEIVRTECTFLDQSSLQQILGGTAQRLFREREKVVQ